MSSKTEPNDLITVNAYYKNRLKNSLTYLIWHGFFEQSRYLIEEISSKTPTTPQGHVLSKQNQLKKEVLNETDEWWLENPNINVFNLKKSSAKRAQSTDGFKIPRITDPPENISSGTYLTLFLQDYLAKKKPVGRTPLMLCARIEDESWSYGLAQNLIEKGAKLGLRDSYGYSALMYACFYERTSMLHLFLNAPDDYSILCKDKFGNTAFHLASLGKKQKTCALMHKIAKKFNIDVFAQIGKNYFGHTPYDLCKMNGHSSCMRTLYANRTVLFKSQSQINNNINSVRKTDGIRSSIDKQSIQSVNALNHIPIITVTEEDKDAKLVNELKLLNEETNDKLDDSSCDINVANPKTELVVSSSMNFDKPVFKSSTETLSAHNDDISQVSSQPFSNNMMMKTHLLVERHNSIEIYKFLNLLKEPLIKINNLNLGSGKVTVKKVQQNIIKYDYQNEKRNMYNCKITRLIKEPVNLMNSNFLLPTLEPVTLLKTSTNAHNLKPNNIKSATPWNFSWRENLKDVFECLEFSSSKSFRKSNLNLATNLFEELASTSALLNFNLNSNPVNVDVAKKTNVAQIRNKQISAMSMQSNDRRQSHLAMMNNKQSRNQRRTSIMSNS
jgi:hypothetical protein